MSEPLRLRITIRSDYRITIPENMRKNLGMKEGSVLELQQYGQDKILITVLVK